jgi:hypothetical protein
LNVNVNVNVCGCRRYEYLSILTRPHLQFSFPVLCDAIMLEKN